VVHNFTRWLALRLGFANLGLFDAMPSVTDTGSAVAPAIVNAILDATGVSFTDLPVTAEKVFQALQERGQR
jgi:hypothetical protein